MKPDIHSILCIDIGGTHIKGTVLNKDGDFLQDYETEKTPHPSPPEKVLAIIKDISKRLGDYDVVAAGFPGYVKEGVIYTAPKLGNDLWHLFPLAKKLEELLNKPTRVVNDADFQALALTSGKGLEMVITLGTGFGSALVKDGVLLPHLEMSQHPFTKEKNYNDYVGEAALLKIGKGKWNHRMEKVIEVLSTVFNYDHLYISGGNSTLLKFKLGENVSIVGNKEGIKGGAILWKDSKLKSK
ncbi:MAG: ROK family protein [Ginsengibacter sp.]|jgi:polyphosphate glucokinase